MALLKVVVIFCFLIFGILLDFGVLGNSFIGFDYWKISGAPIKNGSFGVFDVLLFAFFAFGGTELVAIAAGETKDPQKTIPRAIMNTFYRIL